MPLKHLTETVLVVVLAILTLATGAVVSTLPPIPEGFFPWAGVFGAAVLYPAVLYPKLRADRADYAFRMLHFAPAAIAILWIVIQVSILKEPRLLPLHYAFTWGWALLPVSVTFLLLAVFCLQVLRRRVPRIAFLVLLLAPFFASAYVSERYTRWDTTLASLLWGAQSGDLIATVSTDERSSALAVSSRGEKNLASSSVPEEEEWRRKLRDVEQGTVHSQPPAIVAETSITGAKATTGLFDPASTVLRKTRLPKSGSETSALGLLLLAGFCAGVHGRARARRVVAQ